MVSGMKMEELEHPFAGSIVITNSTYCTQHTIESFNRVWVYLLQQEAWCLERVPTFTLNLRQLNLA